MAVTTTTYYTASVASNNGYFSYAWPAQTSSVFTFPYSRVVSNGSAQTTVRYCGNTTWYGCAYFADNAGGSSATVVPGTKLYNVSTAISNIVRASPELAVTWTSGSSTVSTGHRSVTVEAINGAVAVPYVVAGGTVVAVDRPEGDTAAATGFLTVRAGDGIPNTGTIASRGNTAGVWKNWTWNSAVLSSGQQTGAGVATATEIQMNLLAGTGDGAIKANFTTAYNPSTTWRAGKSSATVVIHILDDNLNEILNTNTLGALTWTGFRDSYITDLKAESGGVSVSWSGTSPYGAYLLNVPSATFTVVPKSPYTAYMWRLERPGGVDEVAYQKSSVSFAEFAAGNVLHLYLTTASPYPRIRYDGFDGLQPANTSVVDPSALICAVGKMWSSTNTGAFSLQLSPVAWAGATLGITKYVIINDGAPQELPASAKSWTFTSDTEPYSITSVKFKQVQNATNGTLAVTVVKDTDTEDVSVSVAESQQGTQLGTPLTATGNLGYYIGEGDLTLVVTPTYTNGAAPSNYSIALSVAAATESDNVDGLSATISSAASTRSITVMVTRVMHLGTLAGVAINVTRDTSNGTAAVTSTSNTILAPQGAIVVTFTEGQLSSRAIHVSCDAGAGYSLRRIVVTDDAVTPTVFATVGAKTEIDITLSVPVTETPPNIKVILVVVANLVPTPVFNPKCAYDQGKFIVTATGAYGDFRTGDMLTVDVTPVSVDNTYMPGLIVGKIEFNGAEVVATRDNETLSVQVPLAVSTNVFTIAMYAALETGYLPVGLSPVPTLTVTWKSEDTITISAVTYRRLGIGFTVSAEKTRGTNTAISATSALRSIATDFPYLTDSILPFDTTAETPTIGSALFMLKSAQKVTVNYAEGVQYPTVAVSVFSYQTGAYVTQGVRPTITCTPASGVTLSENLLSEWTPPVSIPPDYAAAAVMVRQVTSAALFPVVTISAASGSGRLEVWDGTYWLPRDTKQVALVDDTTFTRWAIGTPPSGRVTVAIGTAQLAAGAGAMPAAVKVYVASAVDGIDMTVYAPSSLSVSKNSALGLSVIVPPGFFFVEWQIGTTIIKGISASLIVNEDITIVPVFSITTTVGAVPMVFGGSDTEYDEGIWISKQFRAQWPWKPLVATVVKEQYVGSALLNVGLGTDIELPDGMFDTAPNITSLSIVDGAMRRIPPTAIQKSRFVRYALKIQGNDTVMSVAVSTGAQTLKGGH